MIHPVDGNAILECVDLTWPWQGVDPFLLCAHHTEHYPAGNADFAVDPAAVPAEQLSTDPRDPDGIRLYFGKDGLPGFPNHPHRGMETVSLLKQGYIDHADSLGSQGRYGPGDVQWMTAGGGIQHAEMFPLLHQDAPNPFELFQIWLNMPQAKKMAPAAYKMMWAEAIPVYRAEGVTVRVIAGQFQPVEGGAAVVAIPPTPDSWAADPASDMAIWTVELAPSAQLMLPASTHVDSLRTLFVHAGRGLQIDGQSVGKEKRVRVVAQQAITLANSGSDVVEVMLMQAVPIAEPVIRSTVYVTTTLADLKQAKIDFQRTQFGGWPWPNRQPMHGPGFRRFAQYAGVDVVDAPEG